MPTDTGFKIFPPHEIFYIESLLFCTESAMRSAEWITQLLEAQIGDDFDFPPQAALNQLQNIALQGASISHFFWPVDKKYWRRGEALREALKIADNNPLHSRTLRNMMEHFDEYLDDYLRSHSAGQFIPDYFGPKPPRDRGPLHFFRAFFSDTAEFEIFGNAVAMQPIVDEIQRIHRLLLVCQSCGGRLTQPKR